MSHPLQTPVIDAPPPQGDGQLSGEPGPSRSTKTRKPRRLTLRQAWVCERGLAPTERSRCRCNGRYRGAMRVPAFPTRWHFAALPANDPHHIPPQRRRISWRKASHMLRVCKEAVEKLTGQAADAVRDKLATAAVQVAEVCQAERVHSRVRRLRQQVIPTKLAPAGFFVVERKHVGTGCLDLRGRLCSVSKKPCNVKAHWLRVERPWDPLLFLARLYKRVKGWRRGISGGPKGWGIGPPLQDAIADELGHVIAQAQIDAVTEPRGQLSMTEFFTGHTMPGYEGRKKC